MPGSLYSLEVQPNIPPALTCLYDFANNLYYSWSRKVRGLFYRMDAELWEACGHNPKIFLRRVAQERVDAALADPTYMFDLEETRAQFERYLSAPSHPEIAAHLDPHEDLIAYFCAEYGFHESFPIYSGGLGILAGDHCKAASDLGLPFIAVGLLYRVGYFTQTIDAQGRQVEAFLPVNFDDLPISPVLDETGKEQVFWLPLPGRQIAIKLWQAHVGRVRLILLDTDLAQNSPQDRAITYRLYDADRTTRIQQEILLGMGGVRALRALGLHPKVWHVNEGHPAFLILERCREYITQGMDFATAFELTACNTVFTTHTPVPAGHDIFDRGLMEYYFRDLAHEMGLDFDRFMDLGNTDTHPNPSSFNMTTLALRGSRQHNGVSRIHRGVAAKMARELWPQIDPEENPIRYVTNGVHVGTFLAREWANLLDQHQRDWHLHLCDRDFWHKVLDQIPDHRFWSLRQSLKREMLDDIAQRIRDQHRRNGSSEAVIRKSLSVITQQDRDVLVIGFARRFATYKRATLLFNDLEQLAQLVNDDERPVVFIFAGKAHPADEPAQAMIQKIWEIAHRPEFLGRILLLEGYDMALARKLVTGVDVWLNTPEYPLEASGTSGQKAGMNGVINLSVLDGWWGEGFEGDNGWAIIPHDPEYSPEYRNSQEAHDLMEILRKEVVPLYYHRDKGSFSSRWVAMSKASMRSILARFNSERMVLDYTRGFYLTALRNHKAFHAEGGRLARELAEWKARILMTWPKIRAERVDLAPSHLRHGQALEIKVAVDLDGLSAQDVRVECQFGRLSHNGRFALDAHYFLEANGQDEQGRQLYTLEIQPSLAGLQVYRIRIVPWHPALT
ncbi:MAG: alpha-glucan family phosphorylase, partial [Gammaproteobacteria bacterium]|nr:alpha-glucan family phosphorylase [Gammaproteobacteria bacterium]